MKWARLGDESDVPVQHWETERARERERERERICRAVWTVVSVTSKDCVTSHCSCAGNLGNSIAGFVDPEIMGATDFVCHII